MDEREQIEQLKEWWRENGWYIIGGLVLGIILLTGWNRYQAHQESRAERAAALYLDLEEAVRAGNAGTAAERLAALRGDHRASPYTAQGGLLMARLQLRQNDPRGAAGTLREVADTARQDEVRLVARLRLARVLAYLGEFEEALQALAVGEPGLFAARYHDVRGDVLVAMGDEDSALEAYMQALIAPGADLVDRGFLQMKITDLAVADAASLPGGFPFPLDEPGVPGLPPLDDPGLPGVLPGGVLDDLEAPGEGMDDQAPDGGLAPPESAAPAAITEDPTVTEEDDS